MASAIGCGLLVVLVLASLASPAFATFPGANGPIAFVSDRDSGATTELYTMNADGSGARRLTTNFASEFSPSFSPDGSRITFQRDGEIYVVNADGTDETQLTSSADIEFDPAFSAGGSRIAYVRNTGADVEIFSMNADGSDQTNLTNSPLQDLAPAFSPDGSRIAFVRNTNVFVMNADGGSPIALTASGSDAAPSFSPDGQRITFLSNRDGNFEIYVMNADGTNQVRLTNEPATDGAPVFSPDGSRIAFASDRAASNDIWVMGADGSSPLNLTSDGFGDGTPDWGATAVDPADPAAVSPPPPPPPRATPPPAADTTAATAGLPGFAAASATRLSASPGAIGSAGVGLLGAGAAASESGGSSRSSAGGSLGPLPGKAISVPAQAGPERGAGTGSDDLVNDNPSRSDVAALFSRPDTLFLSAADIQRSVGIAALLMLLLGLPARLFNKTVQQNRAELAAFFAPVRGAVAAMTPAVVKVLLGVAAVSATTTAAVHVFLDPQFPSREGAAAFALGMLVAFGVIVANQLLTARWYIRRRAPELDGGWVVYPGQIAVSMACVTVSRLAHFVPGLMLGMAGDYEPRRPLPLEVRAGRIALTYSALLAISLAAWCASIPVSHAAQDTGASFAVLLLDAGLAVVAIAGMQTLAFGLVPLMFLDGHPLSRARSGTWLALWSVGIVWLALVVVNPALSHQGDNEVSIGWLAALFAFQALVAVSLWAYFVVRRRRGLPLSPTAVRSSS